MADIFNGDNNNNDENNRYRRKRESKRDRNKKKTSKFYIGIFILVIFIFGIGYVAVDKFMPNFKNISLYKYYTDLNSDKIYIVVGEEMVEIENNPIFKDDELYIPVDFVKENIDKYIFWDKIAERLTITTENSVIKMKTEELSYYINDKPFNLNIPVYNIDGVAYMPSKMLMELYDINIRYDEEYGMTIIDDRLKDRVISEIAVKKSNLRYKADKKSPIEAKLPKGTRVETYGEENGYTKIRTENGLIGYVKNKDITFVEKIEGYKAPETAKNKIESKPIDGKIHIIWDQISTVEASASEKRRITHKGLDVISPTWFSFDDEKLNGDIINIADKGYVDWAHEKGYQVWGLISDNFKSEVSHAVLSDTNTREYVEKQILAFVTMYELDGINIDFENVKKEDADYFIQFLREMYPIFKEKGIILSVDVTVPKPYNLYYNRTEIANASDYVIIMGYDEHYSTSPESGSVASIGFVEEGVYETLKEVPKEKTVLALPYYVRVWRETEENGEVKVRSKAYSRTDAVKMFEENGAKFEWLETPANYYAEYETQEDGATVTYKVWLEEEKSLEEKLKVAKKYDIAGIAGWSSVWLKDDRDKAFLDLVYEYIKK